jgi:hypothetical protein
LAISLDEFVEASKITGRNLSLNRAFNLTKLIVSHINVVSSTLMMHDGTPDLVLNNLKVFEFIMFGSKTTPVCMFHVQASTIQ